MSENTSNNQQSFREFLMEGYKGRYQWEGRAANQMGKGADVSDDGEQYKEHALNVPYALRYEAKKYGATWDNETKKWYIRGPVPEPLKAMLPMTSNKIYLNVPYSEKDEAKKYGVAWDRAAKKWYYAGDNPPAELNKWREGHGNVV